MIQLSWPCYSYSYIQKLSILCTNSPFPPSQYHKPCACGWQNINIPIINQQRLKSSFPWITFYLNETKTVNHQHYSNCKTNVNQLFTAKNMQPIQILQYPYSSIDTMFRSIANNWSCEVYFCVTVSFRVHCCHWCCTGSWLSNWCTMDEVLVNQTTNYTLIFIVHSFS